MVDYSFWGRTYRVLKKLEIVRKITEVFNEAGSPEQNVEQHSTTDEIGKTNEFHAGFIVFDAMMNSKQIPVDLLLEECGINA